MEVMFYSASAFNHDISSWTGTAATTAQGAVVFWRDCISSQILVRRRHHRRVRAMQSKSLGSHLLRLLLLPHHLPLPHHHNPLPHHHLHLLLLRRQPRRLRKFPRRPRRFSSPFSRSGELAILIAPRPPERRKARKRKSISQTKPPFRYKKKKSVVVVSSVFCAFLFSCIRVKR